MHRSGRQIPRSAYPTPSRASLHAAHVQRVAHHPRRRSPLSAFQRPVASSPDRWRAAQHRCTRPVIGLERRQRRVATMTLGGTGVVSAPPTDHGWTPGASRPKTITSITRCWSRWSTPSPGPKVLDGADQPWAPLPRRTARTSPAPGARSSPMARVLVGLKGFAFQVIPGSAAS